VNCTDEELAEMIHHALIQACEHGSSFAPQEQGLVTNAMINLPIAARELRKRIGVASCTDEELGEMIHDALILSVEGWWEDFGAQTAEDEALIVDGRIDLRIAARERRTKITAIENAAESQ
jgi:hypothetical protein